MASNKPSSQVPKPKEPLKSFNFKNTKPAPTTSKEKKVTTKNDYFDSDDDDLILSIPLEQLSAENPKPSTTSTTLSNKKEPQVKFSHTSVIPTKRENINVSSDKNRIQNQSNSKPLVQSKSGTYQVAYIMRQTCQIAII